MHTDLLEPPFLFESESEVAQSCLTLSYQASLSMGFSRQEYWSGLPFPSAGDLPEPGIEPGSAALLADTLPPEPPVLYSESEVAQLCPTLCDPMDCTSQAPLVRELFQAIVLEWVAISFYRGSSQPRDRTRVSYTAGGLFICLIIITW